MATAPSTQTDEAHEAEVAKQAEIASEVEASAPPVETVQEEAPIVEEQPPVTIRVKEGVELEFPINVSVVGVEDGLTFTGPRDTVEVPPAVAEQITYSPAVEVAS